MDSKPSSRRDLLKGGALAVGAAATGAITPAFAESPASGPAPASGAATAPASYLANVAPMVPSTDETIGYGLRSHYVTAKRIQEAGRATPKIYTDFGLTAHVFSPLQDFLARSRHRRCTTSRPPRAPSSPTSIPPSTP